MHTFLGSVKNCKASKPPSLPTPEFLTPPKGVLKSLNNQQFTQTIPVCNLAKLHTGIVWVNCWLLRDLRTPFGGVKNSGVGREGGFEALQFFTEPKNVCIKL